MCRQHFLLQKLLLNARQCSLTRTPGNTISEGIKLKYPFISLGKEDGNKEKKS